MPGCVSRQLYLLLDALENFDISLDFRSREISNFPTHLYVYYIPVIFLAQNTSVSHG